MIVTTIIRSVTSVYHGRELFHNTTSSFFVMFFIPRMISCFLFAFLCVRVLSITPFFLSRKRRPIVQADERVLLAWFDGIFTAYVRVFVLVTVPWTA